MLAKNYGPIIVSNVLSKLIEMYMLEEVNSHILSDMQFGFIKGREVRIWRPPWWPNYCVNRGSSGFMCCLDIEGAFDGLPHAVLIRKAMDIFTDIMEVTLLLVTLLLYNQTMLFYQMEQ